MTEALVERIDWSALPPGVQRTIQLIGSHLVEGCSRAQIARELGRSPAWVQARVAELRDAIEAQLERRPD
jgi:DNA-directed RNA polymerase specialized sigma24 family protein